MMYGFGDSNEPLVESAKIIEEVVLQQMRIIVKKACDVADMKGASAVNAKDFIFLLRKDKVKLQRLLKYLELKQFKASMYKILEAEQNENTPNADIFDNSQKLARPYNSFLEELDTTGELLENRSVIDYVKQNRCIRAEMMTQKMDSIHYIEYSKARSISFANKNRHKFCDWISTGGDITISKEGYIILGYLAYETVAQIVDLAFLVRQDQSKIHGDAIDRLRLSHMNSCTLKTFQCNKGTIVEPLTPSEITEAIRRYWSPQLNMTGPFQRWSTRPNHLKLFAC
ncbi:transcription initiation protein SPT3 homolog isoform X2 [Prorops nasuta]